MCTLIQAARIPDTVNPWESIQVPSHNVTTVIVPCTSSVIIS